MDPVTLGLIAMGGGGLIKGIGGLFDQSADDKAAYMRVDADLRQSALEETMRRAEGRQTQILSSTKARMAATGFSSDSKSFTQYLTGMAQEFQKQNEFTRTQTMKSIEMERGAADLMTENQDFWKGLNFAGDILGEAGSLVALGK